MKINEFFIVVKQNLKAKKNGRKENRDSNRKKKKVSVIREKRFAKELENNALQARERQKRFSLLQLYTVPLTFMNLRKTICKVST